MAKRIEVTVSTKNEKGFTFVSDGLESDGKEIAVRAQCNVPESLEEAASADFYGTEEAAMTALQQDWQRRAVNAARPLLRTAEMPLDWETIAQTAIDGYKPGRRGGFAPKISDEELDAFDDIEALREHLRKLGMVRVGAEA